MAADDISKLPIAAHRLLVPPFRLASGRPITSHSHFFLPPNPAQKRARLHGIIEPALIISFSGHGSGPAAPRSFNGFVLG